MTLKDLENKYKTFFNKANLYCFFSWALYLAFTVYMLTVTNFEKTNIIIACFVFAIYTFAFRFETVITDGTKIELNDILEIAKYYQYDQMHIEEIKKFYATKGKFEYGWFLVVHIRIVHRADNKKLNIMGAINC